MTLLLWTAAMSRSDPLNFVPWRSQSVQMNQSRSAAQRFDGEDGDGPPRSSINCGIDRNGPRHRCGKSKSPAGSGA